jgi:cytochrome c biogenesis protein CcdA
MIMVVARQTLVTAKGCRCGRRESAAVMGEILLGTTLLASFLGGVVALLAPCCMSVMLPAYLSTGFRRVGPRQ